MASNLIVNTLPPNWVSAYDDSEFIFDLRPNYISSTANSGGYPVITVSTAWDANPIVNKQVYVNSGVYVGYHKVRASTNTTVTLDTAYISNQTTGTVTSIRCPQLNVYKGFKPSEIFGGELAYTLVSSLNPSINSERQVIINLSGILRRIFTISPPATGTAYDNSIFNAYRIEYDTEVTTRRHVINSCISNADLNTYFVNTGRYLINTSQPLLFGCGTSFMTVFGELGFPRTEVWENGVKVQSGFGSSFDNSFEDPNFLD